MQEIQEKRKREKIEKKIEKSYIYQTFKCSGQLKPASTKRLQHLRLTKPLEN